MSKKGFTLVELMVVIVIIGVLAAVAVPRLMAAADRARAAEGPQTLGSVARFQHAYRVEATNFINLTVADNWSILGFDNGIPTSRWFAFSGNTGGAAFQAMATPRNTNLRYGGLLWINSNDCRGAHNLPALANRPLVGTLVPGWNCQNDGPDNVCANASHVAYIP